MVKLECSSRKISRVEKCVHHLFEFCKYDLRTHVLETSPDIFPCSQFALNFPCTHEHVYSSVERKSLHNLCSWTSIIIGNASNAPTEPNSHIELKNMQNALQSINVQISRYIWHVFRAIWQSHCISDMLISIHKSSALSTNTIILTIDHKKKIMPRRLKENQLDYFDKSAMTLLGCMFSYSTENQDGNYAQFECTFLDIVLRCLR